MSAGAATILYVLANVAYFAAIPKKELAESGVIVAGLFFKNVFGDNAGGRALPAFVALSNLGNVLAVSFAHSRVNQGKDSSLWGGGGADHVLMRRIADKRCRVRKGRNHALQ